MTDLGELRMFERLMARGLRHAEVQRARRVAALAEAVVSDLPPDIAVETGPDGIMLVGRGLRRRMLGDVRLRAIGLWAKGEGR
jgi:hypothetical protein